MIAVTGANGLLGNFIVRELVSRGEPVVAVVRSEQSLAELRDLGASIICRVADVCDTVALENALDGVTRVVHAAAKVSFNPRDARAMYDVNVLGTRNMVDVSLALGVRRFVHISSIAALGRQKNQEYINETNTWLKNPLNSTYAESKFESELEVFRGLEEGLNAVILNPSLILAPAAWDRSSARVFKYVWEQRKFYIDGQLNYVDVRDVAELVARFLSHGASGERFILNAGAITYQDFFTKVGNLFSKRPPSVKVSPGLLRMIARVEHARSRLFGTNPIITRETARLAQASFFYDNAKVRKTLNFDFKTIDSTLNWCTQEFQKMAGAKI